MQQFVRKFIVPLARAHRWHKVCEVGASTGLSTDQVLRLPDISYTIVDPCLEMDLGAKYAKEPRVRVLQANSLDGLPLLNGEFDCILIDGDHNWYTVYNELRLIRERDLLRRRGMVFFHDVGWPYGRRDGYYQPETIPPEFRLPYEHKGIIRGRSKLAEVGGFNAGFPNVVHEGGEKNGVLTAIEDFMCEHPSEYNFCWARIQFGLGIMQYRTGKTADDAVFARVRVKATIYSLLGLFATESRLMSQPKNVVRG